MWVKSIVVHGSSPRARGTPSPSSGPGWKTRFIPASAGNTALRPHEKTLGAVHPRERGEHDHPRQRFVLRRGSSPRARGTHPAARRHRVPRRFIPASAGNTREALRRFDFWPVHPRERGEHCVTTAGSKPADGSSPRARGTQIDERLSLVRKRFIPASAGNTWWTVRPAPPPAVHPRERGEHMGDCALTTPVFGSSPRARGTRAGAPPDRGRQRFIPASAGNTGTLRQRDGGTSVHPRERGEHHDHLDELLKAAGSSPRARGTRLRSHSAMPGRRFIPASAGNTMAHRSLCPLPAVHPRERGEHAAANATGMRTGGSSPRARGTRTPADRSR